MKRSIHKEIFQLTLPNIISNISVPLIGSVDTILMGHISTVHLGAVGLGSMIFSFLYWNMGFLRMSTTGLTAQAYGREDSREQYRVLIRAILVALVVGLILILLRIPLASAGLAVFSVEEAQRELVRGYVQIRMIAAPASLALMVLLGWYLGMQNAKLPLLITVIINLSNIGISYLLVVTYGYDMAGVAWGTVIAQYIGASLAIALWLWKYREVAGERVAVIITELEEYGKFFRVNSDIIIRTMVLTLVFGFMYRESSRLGVELLAVHMVLFQFLNWMSYIIDGLAYAAESLVGKYFGAESIPGVRRAVRWTMIWSLVGASLISLVYAMFYEDLFWLFTDDRSLTVEMHRYYLWVVILPLAGFASYVWDGIFIGLVASKAMRICMLLAGVVFVLSYVSLRQVAPAHSLWAAFTLFLIARAAAQAIYYQRKQLYRSH